MITVTIPATSGIAQINTLNVTATKLIDQVTTSDLYNSTAYPTDDSQHTDGYYYTQIS